MAGCPVVGRVIVTVGVAEVTGIVVAGVGVVAPGDEELVSLDCD